jgi:hypothetical protein
VRRKLSTNRGRLKFREAAGGDGDRERDGSIEVGKRDRRRAAAAARGRGGGLLVACPIAAAIDRSGCPGGAWHSGLSCRRAHAKAAGSEGVVLCVPSDLDGP